MDKCRLRFHWSLFLRFESTIFQHWFRWWLGADQTTSHHLNQWWLVYWRIYASLGINESICLYMIIYIYNEWCFSRYLKNCKHNATFKMKDSVVYSNYRPLNYVFNKKKVGTNHVRYDFFLFEEQNVLFMYSLVLVKVTRLFWPSILIDKLGKSLKIEDYISGKGVSLFSKSFVPLFMKSRNV